MLKKNFRKILLCAIIISTVIVNLSAENRQIVLGGKNGWDGFQYEDKVTTGKGRFGYECIELETNSFVFDETTDLLIDFENSENPIAAGNYDVVSNKMKISTDTIMEKNAGLSRNIGGMSVLGKPGAFFGPEGLRGSFSIEFWLCPSIAENGEVILNWESSKNVRGRLIYQLLNCSFNGGHLEWTLSHFFDSYEGPKGDGEVKLSGKYNIIPDKWSYHVLSFDSEAGILEYIVDGITEDLVYITDTGREGGAISLIILGAASEMNLCSEFTGKIDDFRILKRPYSPPDYQSAEMAGKSGRMIYAPAGGRFETKPIRVSTGSVLNSITAEMNVPEQTGICYFVRSGDNFFNWSDSYPEWKPVESGETLTGVTGLYFQIACDLYPDGDGVKTPSVTSITMDFTEIPLPLPPFTIKAEAGNGKVTLNWNYSVDDTTGGYYIYYGNRPGEYLGRVAVEGNSPVKIGNTTSFTLTGLENGRIYYFAVASWSNLDERVIGPLSKEVFARPLERLEK